MQRRRFLRLVASSATALALPELSGCGTLMYPERVGQPKTGPLDWKVVALDGIGLVLFVVPGIVAFAVDFYNGAIYLPPDHYQPPIPRSGPVPQSPPQWPTYSPYPPAPGYSGPTGPGLPPPNQLPAGPGYSSTSPPPAASPNTFGQGDLRKISVPPEQLTRAGIAAAVSQELGREVTFNDSVRAAPLERLDDFATQQHRLAEGESSLPLSSVFVGEADSASE